MSWIIPNDHYKDDVLACKGIQLLDMDNSNRYHRVAIEVVGTSFLLNTDEAIEKDNIIVGDPSDWLILPVDLEERIYISF